MTCIAEYFILLINREYMTKNKWKKIISIVIIAVLGAIVCYQAFLVTNNYIRQWRMPIWRLRNESSFARSAVFILSSEGADFLHFINQILPTGVKVVPPEKSGAFSEQSLMQFFLLDKSIMLCPSGEARIECLSKPDKYLIATTAYPPHDSDIDKTFIAYPNANAEYPYEGIYVPRDYVEGTYSAVYPDTYNIPLTLLSDMGILLAWFMLGWLIVSCILRDPIHPVAFITGFPIGLGVFTWSLFIVSLVGAPLTRWTLLITYTFLLLVALALAWRLLRKMQLPKLSLSGLAARIKRIHFNLLSIALCAVLGFLVLSLIYISIGRGYSTFDDMAIWSLKGYYMAFKHDIFAAAEASGHGLSYPLNLSLTISTFYLIDQDLLPGSKVAYVLLFLSMLAGIYWFLRNNNTSRILASLGVLLVISTPVIFEYATLGFANTPYACYLVLGTLLSVMGAFQNKPGFLYAGGLALSLAGWTRPEGIGFALLLVCLIGMFALKNHLDHRTLALYFLITISLCGSWMVFGYRYISGDEIGSTLRQVMQTIKDGSFSLIALRQVLDYAWHQFINEGIWGGIIPLAALTTIGLLFGLNKTKVSLSLVLAIASLGVFSISVLMLVAKYYEGTKNFPLFLYVSFDRAQFPGVILLILTFILVVGNILNKTRLENNQSH